MKKEKSIQVLIAKDHEIIRYGIKYILDQQHDIEVVSESLSCEQTIKQVSKIKPDLVLLDLILSDGGSIGCIPKIKELCPSCKVLVYTASVDKMNHMDALRAGADGIFLKEHSTQLLCKAIRSICLRNELWVDKTLTAEMWKQNVQTIFMPETFVSISKVDESNLAAELFPLNKLTPRENQIASLSSKGLRARQIGEKLFISEKTVRNQLTTIYRKLDVKNQLELSINRHLLVN